jgi:uncharacterized protein YndB with AHSA1/START domain
MTAPQVSVERVDGTVRAEVALPGCSPKRALEAFTEPELLRQWWGGGELSAALVPGGAYRVRFEAVGHTLAGTVVDHRPGALLVFGWAWAHQPAAAGEHGSEYGYDYEVEVQVREAADGALVELVHRPREGVLPDAEAVQGHLEGWEYFLPRLAATV